jgi:hypothetical protein
MMDSCSPLNWLESEELLEGFAWCEVDVDHCVSAAGAVPRSFERLNVRRGVQLEPANFVKDRGATPDGSCRWRPLITGASVPRDTLHDRLSLVP